MKKLLSLFFVLFLTAHAFGTNYYFSLSKGNDTYTGRDTSHPWQSISKFNSYFVSLLPGDSVLFRRGETWSGTNMPSTGLIIKKSGQSGKPIYIGAYGNGAKPVFSGLKDLPDANWGSTGTNIWENSTTFVPSPSTLEIVMNAIPRPLQVGRYPNAEDSTGYIAFQSHQGDSTITAKGLPTSPSWVNAEMCLRAAHWRLDRYTVLKHVAVTGGSKLSYSTSSNLFFANGWGFFLTRDRKTLNKSTEWYYNPSTDKLSYYSTTSPKGIRVGTVADILSGSGYSYITIENIKIEGANRYGINMSSGTNVTVKNVLINAIGQIGIKWSSVNSSTISNDTITNCLDHGIHLTGPPTYVKVLSNLIQNSGILPGMGQTESTSYKGIELNKADHCTVEFNQVDSSGYQAINMSSGSYNKLSHNFVNGYNFIKDDGGAFYTGTRDNIGNHIDSNIILNGYGAKKGTTTTYSAAVGLYGDFSANNLSYTGNVIAYTARGIYVNTGEDNVVKNNIIFDTETGGMYFAKSNTQYTIQRNIVDHNQFYADGGKGQHAFIYNNFTGDASASGYPYINNLGTIDYNYYAQPYKPTSSLYVQQTSSSHYNYTVPQWQAGSVHDDHGHPAPVTYTTQTNQDTSVKLVYNPSKIKKTITLGGKNWKGMTGTLYHNDTIQVPPYQGAILFRDTGLAKTSGNPVNNKPSVTILTPANNSTGTVGTTIQLTADASDPDPGGYISKVEYYAGTSTLIGSSTSPPYIVNWTPQTATTYLLTAKAYDDKLLTGTSPGVNVTVNPKSNVQPNVTLTTDKASYTAPATVLMTAAPSDQDGFVRKVTFYRGSTYLGYRTASPWTWTTTGLAVGNYNLTARVTDDFGDSAASNVVAISVTAAPIAPKDSLTQPANNDTFSAPATIPLQSIASDPDGKIARVDFYVNNVLTRTVTGNIGTYTPAPLTNVAAGSYDIYSKATDSTNLSTSSGKVTVYVGPSSNAQPSVTLNTPVGGMSYVAPATVSLSATAFDGDNGVKWVEFYYGGTLIKRDSTYPYSYTWTNVAAGKYNITAKATDSSGDAVTQSATSNVHPIEVNAASNAPTITLTSPSPNAIYTIGDSVRISADATDVDTIRRVVFYVNGDSVNNQNIAPYAFWYHPATINTYSITGKVIDKLGFFTTSGATLISVKTVTTNKKPTVTLTDPDDGSTWTVGTPIPFAATASDSDGVVKKVDFYAGSSLLKTDTTAPYSFTWSNAPAASYSITARVTDDKGAVTGSNSASILVYAPNKNPTVRITAPTSGTTYTVGDSVTITATASDSDGVVKYVDFLRGDTLIFRDSVAPYLCIAKGLSLGTHNLIAVATDDDGSKGSSPSVVITFDPVVVNSDPTVSLSLPANNASFTAPADVPIAATATDADGTIAALDFIIEGPGFTNPIRMLSAPYSDTLLDLAAGDYNIQAKAYDNDGGWDTSATRYFTVTDPVVNIPPKIVLNTPTEGQQYQQWATVVFNASVTVGSSPIARVEFYNGTTLLNRDYASPWTYSWPNVKKGAYQVKAKVIDTAGRSQTVTRNISVVLKTNTTIKAPTSTTPVVQ